MTNKTKTQIEQDKAATEFKATDISRRAADSDGRTKTATTNHSYPTFPTSGPKTHLGQIGRAFEDIDNRIDGVSGDIANLSISAINGLSDALAAKADTSAIPTIPGNATASAAGLMSAEDKTKLDGLQNYTLPEATADTLGGVKVGAGLQIQKGTLTTSMNQAKFVPDPAGDTVTKEEFIALRNALVTAGIMAAQA